MTVIPTVLPPAVFGVSGNASRQMLDRLGSLALDDIAGATADPDIAVLYGFPNDPALDGTTIDGATWTYSQATTQNYCQALILGLMHGATGNDITYGGAFAAGQATLPATGRAGQRIVVLSDTSTSGGIGALDSTQAATITGTVASSGPAVWEFRRRQVGERGWGRIAASGTAPTKCSRILVIGTNYKNWTSDGSGTTAVTSAGRRDTTSTPEPWYAQVRTAMAAAVAACAVTVSGRPAVVYADLYGYQRTMIVGGTFPASGSPALADTFAAGYVPDFSGGAGYDATKDWHHASSNQHHGRFGHEIVARVATLAVVNAGWAADLTTPANLHGDCVNVKILGDSQTDLAAGYCRAADTWGPTFGRMLQSYLGSPTQ